MPRTKARQVPNKRNRNSDEDNLTLQLKEMQRVHDEFESEQSMVWQQGKEEIHDIIQKFRGRFSRTALEMTIGELISGKVSTDSLLTEASVMSKNDDGYVTEGSTRSSRSKKVMTVDKKSRRRSQSVSAMPNSMPNASTMSARTLSRNDLSTHRASRSKYRTPGNRLQTMSADRSVMNPVTPKIQMNTPVSLLRYPKIGETVISMSGSPVIVNGGTQQGVANINIPIANGMFSMQPNAITNIDSDLVSRIDNITMTQLKQLQANLAIVMNTMSKMKK